MTLLDLMIKIGAKDEASDKVGGIGDKVMGMVGNAAKLAAGAMTGIVAGVGAIGSLALKSYSDFEQLQGGVAKLYGNAGQTLEQYAAATGKAADEVRGTWERNEAAQKMVMDNAAKAYKTAGMSANQYLRQATNISAALINSLGGDTQKAAELTDTAMRAMSDNVNTFGSNAEDVQNAIQGISKQNYTMLDNLKLGYGGTKTEMQRLIDDANAWGAANGEASNLSIDSFADCVTAIQQVQEAQGIAGATAKEAASTIEGSVGMAKAAWENLLAGLGNEDADLSQLTQNLMDALGAVAENVIPRIAQIGEGMVRALPAVFAKAGEILAPALLEALVTAWNIAASAIRGLGIPLPDVDTSQIMNAFNQVVDYVQNTLVPAFQPIVDAVTATIGQIVSAAEQELAYIMPHIEGAINKIAPYVTPMLEAIRSAIVALMPVLGEIISVGMAINAVVMGFVFDVGSQLIAWILRLITDVANFVTSVVTFFTVDIPNAFNSAVEAVQQFYNSVINFFTVEIPAGIAGFFAFLSQIPANINAALSAAIAFVLGFAAQFIANAINAGSGFLQNIGSFIGRIPGTISGFLMGAINVVSGFVGSLATHAMNAGMRFLSGIQNGFNSAISFVRGIPSRILGALGNVGSLLTSAGKSIIDGFLNGLKSSFEGVKNFVGGIGSWIASHKGPIEYDRKLLIPNGKAVMQSLHTGLAAGFTSDVMPYVSDMAGHIQGALTPSPMSVAMDAALDAQGAQDSAYSAATARLEETLIRLFETRLGAIIEANAPYMTVREARRVLA